VIRNQTANDELTKMKIKTEIEQEPTTRKVQKAQKGQQRNVNSNNGNIRVSKSTHDMKLKCFYSNADQMMNKRDELKLLIQQHKPVVIGITE